MTDSQKFIPIDEELTLLRETHRLVLSWQSLRTEPFHSFLVSLHPPDLVALGLALQQESIEFRSADTELEVDGDSKRITLCFRRRTGSAIAAEGSLRLEGEARERFEAAIHRLKKR